MCTRFVRPLSASNDNVIFASIMRQMPPPPPTHGIECVSRDDQTHSSDKKCATTTICECVITGLGFQKEMTHPSDDVEETMNTHIYIFIMRVQVPPPRTDVPCRRSPGLQNAFYHLA